MKILLTGASGQLGNAILNTKPSIMLEEEINLISTTRDEIDLSNPDLCKKTIIKLNPDWVINAAAYTMVDQAEDFPDLAFTVNSQAPKAMAEALKFTGGKLLQISTDFVFDGQQGIPYKPFDKRKPLNIYGETKAKGEEAVEKILISEGQGKILRTSWLMGPIGNNFALTMLRMHREKNQINVVSDQIGSPTSTIKLALACWRILKKDLEKKKFSDVLHYCDSGVASWYDVAIAVGEISKRIGIIDEPAKVNPIPALDWKTKAKRPNFSVLENLYTIKELNLEPVHWRNALEDMIKRIN